jgi:hypothetical protein
MKFMGKKTDFVEALPTISCTLCHSYHHSVYPCSIFWLLMQNFDMHFCYQEFSAEKMMSTLALCTNPIAQPNNWLLNDTNLLKIMLDLQFHIVSELWLAVLNVTSEVGGS